jgi:hypothetical protein
MISLADCMGLCDLSPEEVQAISEHEHVPESSLPRLGAISCTASTGRRRSVKSSLMISDQPCGGMTFHTPGSSSPSYATFYTSILRRRSIASRNMQTGWATPPLGSVRVQEAGQR